MSSNLRLSSLFTFVLVAGLSSSCVVHVDGEGGGIRSTSWFGSDSDLQRGSGVAATQTRDVPEFRSVELESWADVNIAIAPERSVKVTADDNLVDAVRTRVEGGRLVIDHESGSYDHRVKVVVEIATPVLEAVELEGSGAIAVKNLDAASFAASLAGSGTITASGKCDELKAVIAGSGDVRMFEVVARHVTARIAGSGTAQVHAHDKLTAEISGSGDIRYRGKPSVDSTVSGSGTIRRD
jgi:hypothetical protein